MAQQWMWRSHLGAVTPQDFLTALQEGVNISEQTVLRNIKVMSVFGSHDAHKQSSFRTASFEPENDTLERSCSSYCRYAHCVLQRCTGMENITANYAARAV